MKYNVTLSGNENDANNKVKKQIAPGSTVLEFGSANGRLTRYLKEELGCKVYIVELEEAAFKDAIQYAEDGVCGDILEKKWLERFSHIRFDYITFLDVLEHLYFPEQALRDCKGLLKEQGEVFISVPNIANNAVLINLFENRFNYTNIGLLDNTHIRFFARDNLPEFCECAGFRIVQEDAVIADFNENEQYRTMRKIHPELLRLLESREDGAIYQFVLTLKKSEFVSDIKSEKEKDTKPGKKLTCKLYYDTGRGLNEKESVSQLIQNLENFEYTFLFPEPIKACRFDPVENCGCIVKKIELFSDVGFLTAEPVNGCSEAGLFLFDNTDPQIQIVIPEGKNPTWITVKMSAYAFQDMEIYKICQLLKKNVQMVFNTLEEKKISEEQLTEYYQDMIKQKDQLQKTLLEEKDEQTQAFLALKDAETRGFLAEKDQVLLQKDQALSEKDQALSEKDQALSEKDQALSEKDQALSEKDQALSEKDQALSEKDQALSEKDQALSEKDQAHRDLSEEKAIVEKDLATYQQHYGWAIEQRDDLTNQLAVVNAQYAAIQQSGFWRLTKPLRVTFDFIKKMLNGNRFTRLLYKGIVSLKNNGIRITCQKIKLKISQNKYAEVSSAAVLLSEQERQYQEGTTFESITKFSILVPLYNTPELLLREMIDSVQKQTYKDWELCLADGSDESHAYVQEIVSSYQVGDSRILYQKIENKGISGNSNICAAMSEGDYIALLDHDDILMPNALFEMKLAIDATAAQVLYSDEDRLDVAGQHCRAFYKPDWSPDLLYSQMYICHFLVFERSLFLKIGGFDSAFDGAQDYDLMLRFSEQTETIHHIPKLLYSWRETVGSTATDVSAKPYAHTAGKNALDAHLKRKYANCAFAEEGEYVFVYEARFTPLLTETPKISVIIPMKDHWELSDQCVQSIIKKSSYKNYEILILDNNSQEVTTRQWFQEIQKQDDRVRVIDATFPFNWSKLNNFGIRHATGSVFVFLNNDTVVISSDWLERLAENALRKDIGVVGAQLLYEDGTLQHAGVVVGMGGWADHVFKGCPAVHTMAPFISPMLGRNVLAVTGACMAISKETIDKIGGFDEEFIICGSDVEICLRAYEAGLNNLYDARVKLYHLESKSRDTYIPPEDFARSEWAYSPYREEGDPYFNINLDIDSPVPRGRNDMGRLIRGFKHHLKRYKIVRDLYTGLQKAMAEPVNTNIPEVTEMHGRIGTVLGDETRLNLMVPTVSKAQVFGGVATALEIFYRLADKMQVKARIILTDTVFDASLSVLPTQFVHRRCDENVIDWRQVVSFGDRYNRTIPVEKGDVFVATAWWTVYAMIPMFSQQKEWFGGSNKLVYLVQDYEPGFYQWSSRYLMAESTYRLETQTIAVFNSRFLGDFFKNNGYTFAHEICFDPILNTSLREYISQVENSKRKKQILIYGRPSVARNAFEVAVESLREWCAIQPNAMEWTLLSAGEQHESVDLGNGNVLRSVGKLTLDQYATIMLETYAGVSLMVSPHPSYPPMEMAAFGVKTITNTYANKDLSDFSSNIYALTNCSKYAVAKTLKELCENFSERAVFDAPKEYIQSGETLDIVANEIESELI